MNDIFGEFTRTIEPHVTRDVYYTLGDVTHKGCSKDFLNILPYVFSGNDLNAIMQSSKDCNNDSSLDDVILKHYFTNMSDNFDSTLEFSNDLYSFLSKKYHYKNGVNTRVDSDNFSFKMNLYGGIINSIEGRIKDPISFIEKYRHERLKVEDQKEIKDMNGIRIVVRGYSDDSNCIKNCYSIARDIFSEYPLFLNDSYTPLIKDFITNPQVRELDGKREYYKAIHFYVPNYETLFEIQVRPEDIHRKCDNPNSPLCHDYFKVDKLSNLK